MPTSLYLSNLAKKRANAAKMAEGMAGGVEGAVEGLTMIARLQNKLKEDDLAAEQRAHGREIEARNQARADERFSWEKEDREKKTERTESFLGYPEISPKDLFAMGLAEDKADAATAAPSTTKEKIAAALAADPTKQAIQAAKLEQEKAKATILGKKAAGDGGAASAAKKEKEDAKAATASEKNVDALRREFNARPQVKSFADVSASYEKMKRAAAAPSAAGDMSLIYGFMKMQDPGSTVREGEFASAQNAGGVSDQIRNQYNRALSGERLNPDQRTDFMAQAANFYATHKDAYDAEVARYGALVKKRGGAVEDVVGGAPSTSGAPPSFADLKKITMGR